MRHWHAAGVRPSRHLHSLAQSNLRLPCSSLRPFGRLAANNFRHSRFLLDHDPQPPSAIYRPVEPVLDTASTVDAPDATVPATSAPSTSDAADHPSVKDLSAPSGKDHEPNVIRNRQMRQRQKESKMRKNEYIKNEDKDSVSSAAANEAEIESQGQEKPDNTQSENKAENEHVKNTQSEDKAEKEHVKHPSPRTGRRKRLLTKKRPGTPTIRKVLTDDTAQTTQPHTGQLRTENVRFQPEKMFAPAFNKDNEEKVEQVFGDSEDTVNLFLEAKSDSPRANESRSLKDVMLGKKPAPSYRKVRSPAKEKPLPKRYSLKDAMGKNIHTIKASTLELTPLDIEQPPVPHLFHGLDRVLFNQGVYQLQDPHSMVYNFDPYIQKIMPVTEFDYNALKEYKTSSQDTTLSDIATEHGKKYVGSTSSMTGTLGHFHYLLSNWRKINLQMLSKEFPDQLDSFTELNRSPNAIFLRWKNGTYAIDADKQFDGANVLMLLGKSLEKLLTMPVPEFERYRRGNSDSISHKERNEPESYHYSTQGDFLMRSQLDAYDPRLPGTGMFDLKTRAVVSIRMQAQDYEDMSGYEIHKQHGQFESFEREYYDMLRSTTLKYSLQARMGRMDGIFVAYHNVKRIFGFQYLSLNEMDRALHGQTDRCLGNQEFSLSVELLNKALDKATKKFPEQSIRFHFETRPAVNLPFMYIFAEPMTEDKIDEIQNSQKAKVAEYERSVMGIEARPEEAKEDGSEKPLSEEMATDVAEQPDMQQEQNTESAVTSGTDEAETSDVTEAGETTSKAPASEDSSEDSTFLSFVSGTEKGKFEEDLKPLLAMVLTVRSKVNGQSVDRPEDLRPEDKWNVEYTLDEIESRSHAWSLYEATKRRRQKSYDKINGVSDFDDPGNDDGKRAKNNDYYINMLRKYSQKGRELRNEIDLAELDKEQVVVGEPHGKVGQEKREKESDKSQDVKIEGAQDYMSWLYADQKA